MLDEELYNKLVEYNKERKYNKDIENSDKRLHSIINALYNKISRIKRRLVHLLNHRQYIWFITFTFDDVHISLCSITIINMNIIKSKSNKPNILSMI